MNENQTKPEGKSAGFIATTATAGRAAGIRFHRVGTTRRRQLT